MFLPVNSSNLFLGNSIHTIIYFLMKKGSDYISMPWLLEEDAKIVKAIKEDRLAGLELPGRSGNQIFRRKRSALLRYERGELSRYIVNQQEEQERKRKERERQMRRERIPSFERPVSQLKDLNDKAEILLSKMEQISPLSPEFAQVVKEYHNVEIRLKSFYFQLELKELKRVKL